MGIEATAPRSRTGPAIAPDAIQSCARLLPVEPVPKRAHSTREYYKALAGCISAQRALWRRPGKAWGRAPGLRSLATRAPSQPTGLGNRKLALRCHPRA